MVIPENQLTTWSNQGAVATSIATHQSIRTALNAQTSPVRGRTPEVYLQGSYKNDTNIRGDSDVDVIAQLNQVFYYDLSSLAENERKLFEQAYGGSSTYSWQDFRADVLQALRAHYGASAVTEGNKSLKVAGSSNRLAADVVVCLQYRKYQRFLNLSNQQYIEGIKFYARNEGRWIVNFPKKHYENGVRKNSQHKTNGLFKPTVRVFKNARTRLVDDGVISDSLAPSYFLECSIYNVPDDRFVNDFQTTFVNIVNWLAGANFSNFICQSEQLPLFGNTPEQWSVSSAEALVERLADLWNNWR